MLLNYYASLNIAHYFKVLLFNHDWLVSNVNVIRRQMLWSLQKNLFCYHYKELVLPRFVGLSAC